MAQRVSLNEPPHARHLVGGPSAPRPTRMPPAAPERLGPAARRQEDRLPPHSMPDHPEASAPCRHATLRIVAVRSAGSHPPAQVKEGRA
jgi:hypothetical protein